MELKNTNLIKLSNVKVIFCDLEDKGFGKSITIDATDESVRNTISKWYADNKIGKSNGVANFKQFTDKDGNTSYQFSFKIGKYTQFSDENISRGDTISLIAKAYTFEHPKFGTGVTHVLNCVALKTKVERKSALQMLVEE